MTTIRIVRVPVDVMAPISEQAAENEIGMWQDAVGGYIEAVRLPMEPTLGMYVNEEGAIDVHGHGPLPPNVRASLLAGQTIRGPAVIFSVESPPEEGSVPEGTALRLAKILRCEVEVA